MMTSTPTGVALVPMPPLFAPCTKCGFDQRTVAWVPAIGAGDFYTIRTDRLDPREHMHVTCGGCGFTWAAAPLDADGANQDAHGSPE